MLMGHALSHPMSVCQRESSVRPIVVLSIDRFAVNRTVNRRPFEMHVLPLARTPRHLCLVNAIESVEKMRSACEVKFVSTASVVKIQVAGVTRVLMNQSVDVETAFGKASRTVVK